MSLPTQPRRRPLLRWAGIVAACAVSVGAGSAWVIDDNGKTVRTAVSGNPAIHFTGTYPGTPASFATYDLLPVNPTWTPAQLERAFGVGSLPHRVAPAAGAGRDALAFAWGVDGKPHQASVTVEVVDGRATSLRFSAPTAGDQPSHARRHVAVNARDGATASARRTLDALGLQGLTVETAAGPLDRTGNVPVSLAPLVGGVPLERPVTGQGGLVTVREGKVIDAFLPTMTVTETQPVQPVPSQVAFDDFRHSARTVGDGDAEGSFVSAELVRTVVPSGPGLRTVPAWVFARADGTSVTVPADRSLSAKDDWEGNSGILNPQARRHG